MATCYATPKEFPAPILDFKDDFSSIEAQVAEWQNRLAESLQVATGEPETGKIIRFPVADGYAQYMVYSLKRGAKLIHLDVWDGYQIDAAHMRGLRASDIRQMIARDEAFRKLFKR